ncbi:unnamed protein product [Closterium sp. Yama58-4]|nr:unnamed protein product [Closterium sp. Yama58-4]
MAQPGNAAAPGARVSPLAQQQQCGCDHRDRRAQSLESQRKRNRGADIDIDASPSAKSARTAACSPMLGSGQFGTVRRCVEKATGTRFACKTILKSRLTSESERHDVRREVVLMQRLAAGASCGATSGAAGAESAAGAGGGLAGYNPHAGVVQLRAVFEDDAAVHMVMELCDGGELFDEIVRRGRLSERDAAQVFSQIVSAVAFCHSRGVLHRDLKPENILLARYPASAAAAAAAGACPRVVVAKLADFGLAIPLKQGERARGVAGSPFYIAPEVLRGDYSLEADLWSLGVILYILLCGAPPFWGPTDKDVFMKVLRGAVDMGGEEWRGVSEEAKGLVRCLLQRDPRRRPPVGKILTHPWILLNCLVILLACTCASPATSQ